MTTPYSPDPANFSCFHNRRDHKRTRFASIEEIKIVSLEELNTIPKCFEDWKKRWLKCLITEGDNIDIDEKINIFEKNKNSAYFFNRLRIATVNYMKILKQTDNMLFNIF